MSHSTVTVVIRDAANTEEAEAALEALLDPFDENREIEPYPGWLNAEEVEQAVAYYRAHPEACTDGDEREEGAPLKPFDEYVTEGNLEAWNDWTRQAVGAYHGGGRDHGIYDAEKDQFACLTTYNPDARWDWWTLGGRWHGFFQLKPKIAVGAADGGFAALSANKHFDDGKVFGEKQVAPFDGTQSAILGTGGVGGDTPEENFEGRGDLARKGDIDFDAMRSLAGQQAELAYDKFEEATKGLPLPESWQETVRRVFFDNNLDPDETYEGSTQEEQKAWLEPRTEASNQAREEYRKQPFIKALQEAELDSFFGDPLDDWCVRDGGRETYVRRAINGSTGTFAFLLDGKWHERGRMGWFGTVSGEKEPEDWHARQRRLLDSLPDDVFLAIVDVHI